jgi:TetR/AcrR family tetracycline transcriptional repressor
LGLDRERITQAALDLLDETGIEGLTMRKLADALGVQAPALYWHFPNKPALLDEMAEALLAGVADRASPSDDFGEVLRRCATELRRALLSRRDGARVFAGTFVVRPNVLRMAEKVVAALMRAGFETQTAMRAMFSLLYFVLGFVIEEQALTEQLRAGGSEQKLDSALAAVSDMDFPSLRLALPELQDLDQDARFSFGVDVIIQGLRGMDGSIGRTG